MCAKNKFHVHHNFDEGGLSSNTLKITDIQTLSFYPRFWSRPKLSKCHGKKLTDHFVESVQWCGGNISLKEAWSHESSCVRKISKVILEKWLKSAIGYSHLGIYLSTAILIENEYMKAVYSLEDLNQGIFCVLGFWQSWCHTQ